MKILAGIAGLFLIVGAFAQGQAEGPQAGIITGRIETDRAGVRSPVRRAKVTLSCEGATDAPTTTTDADARYRFDGLAPGKYSVTVEKPGFVPIKSAAIDVAGASRTADLSLIPGGALEGRLQDDRAGPIAKLPVLADRLSEQGSVAASFAATTDDLGHFRIHSLPAGRYRIRATPPPPASGDEYFYPGTKTAKDAVVIAVTAGVTSDQLDFTVPIAPLSPIAAAAIEGAAQGAGDPVDPKATRITGTVSRSDSGQAIANATAELSDQYGVVRHHAQAGLDGRFEIAKVPAGVWTLSATASGFASVDGSVLRPSGAGIRLTVKDGDRIQKDVVLARVSAIEGRLLDEFGDPVPGVVVQIAQKGSAALGLPFFVSTPSVAATGPTDDRGWFRAPGLFPGDYYLIAVPPPFEQSWMTGFAPTFYPGSTTADAATPISIVSGRDVYDARFAIAGARTRTVTGRIVDGSGKPVEKASFVLMPVENGVVRAMVMVRSAADIDGTFTIRDVPDGTYVVQGFGPRLFGVSAIELPAANREPRPVSVIVKPLTTARGRVVFDSEASTTPQNPKSVALWFQPTNFTSGPVGTIHNAATIGPDWSFEIPNLAWFGVLRVTTPSGWALLRVRHEGRDITDTPFDFQSADVSGLEVVLTNRLGTVSGTVTDAGQPAVGAVVLIFGTDDTNLTHMSRTAASGRTDERGAFKVEGLVPGRYLAVAITGQPTLAQQTNVLALRSLAVPFTATDRTNTVVNLTMSR